jgi:hypothetical protein
MRKKSHGARKRDRGRTGSFFSFDYPPSFTFKIAPMSQPTAHLTAASAPSAVHNLRYAVACQLGELDAIHVGLDHGSA